MSERLVGVNSLNDPSPEDEAMSDARDVIEAVARTIRPMAWALNEDGELLESRRIDRADAIRDAHRALVGLAESVSDGMVQAARLELIPMADEYYMDEHRKRCLDDIRRAISAAIRAATQPTGEEK